MCCGPAAHGGPCPTAARTGAPSITTFAHWAADDTLARLHAVLRGRVRVAAGRTIAPTAAVIDSQSVRASAWVRWRL
jgi:transposase